jgi:outer membrane biosynthesis protein TonB
VKKVVEKAIALDEPEIVEPTPVAPPAPPEAISIKPSKRKVKAEVVPPPPEPAPPEKKVEKKDFSKSRRQQLAEMIRAEQKASEEASILAEEAEIEKRLAEAALNRARAEAASRPSTTSTAESSSSAASQPSNQLSALENRYYAAIIARLQAIWSLPEYKEWDPSLSATVVITVLKNGEIADSFFEVQSGDKIFDRFVTKALQDVGQLPPIPGALKLERKEIGLKFTPGRIQ